MANNLYERFKNNEFEKVGTKKLLWEGTNRNFDVIKINIDELKYNILNGRVAELDLNKNIELNEATYKDIKNSILRQSKEDIDALARNIAKEKLKEPLILNKYGVIVDGNRRYTAISMLMAGEIKPFTASDLADIEWVEAVILNADSSEKSVKLLEYKIQFDDMKKAYDPISRAFDFARSNIKDGITVDQIAEATGIKRGEIEKDIRSVQLIRVYLAAIGSPNDVSLAIQMKLDGPIKEIASSKVNTDYFLDNQQELVDIITTGKTQGGDVTRTVRDLVKGSKSTGNKSIMNSLEVKQKVQEIAEEIGVSKIIEKVKLASTPSEKAQVFHEIAETNKARFVETKLLDLKQDLLKDQKNIDIQRRIDDFLNFIKTVKSSEVTSLDRKKLELIKEKIESF